MIQLLILGIKMIFMAFYIGQYWFAFVYSMIAGHLTSNEMRVSHDTDEQGIFETLNVEVLDSFMYKADGWDLRE